MRTAGGYPSGVSAEQNRTTPDDTPDGPRPGRLTAAAALAALEGAALAVGGVAMLVVGVAGDAADRQGAVTGGVTLLVLALLPLLAARGLFLRRAWSRGPAVITQILALPVAYNLLQSDSVAIPGGIALGVVAVAALVLLVNAETTRALGIRAPGERQDAKERDTKERDTK
ncbi:hypothetical protein GCM10010145_08420 [Streptomyces ruber]|uniref:Integral membrane protein n=2 Tax=Streptomyces TaxID=1883 RepID=A0A918B9S3_9ACTN|nr:hypothetical protein GCM10010145_08420 [Streptomyces ruber]